MSAESCPFCGGTGCFTALRQDLCEDCGRWHDHTGRSLVAVIDWRGRRWPITPGTMPYNNTDDAGGREYGRCRWNARTA